MKSCMQERMKLYGYDYEAEMNEIKGVKGNLSVVPATNTASNPAKLNFEMKKAVS